MQNEKFCSEHGACQEKTNNLIKNIDEICKEQDRMEERISKLEQNINHIDKTMGERMNTLEITYKLGNEQTNNKIDKLDRKVDKLIEKEETQDNTKNNRVYELIKSISLIILGILIAYVFKKAGVN